MKKINRILIVAALALIAGCSQQQAVQTQNQINQAVINLLHNAGATGCSPAMIAKIEGDLPTIGITANQLNDGLIFACSTLFGETPAPTTAPGNLPVFVPAPTPAAS